MPWCFFSNPGEENTDISLRMKTIYVAIQMNQLLGENLNDQNKEEYLT